MTEERLVPEEDPEVTATFRLILFGEQISAQSASGSSIDDPKYAQAESVRPAKTRNYVFVTYKNKEYGPCRVEWAPLDGDKSKLTVTVNTDEGWFVLWFWG